MKTTNKKAYITCEDCGKSYCSGLFVDDKGNLLLDEAENNPGVCPSCGKGITETSDVQLFLKSIKLDLTKYTTPNSIFLETFKHPTQREKLKIPCPYCSELRELSSEECEHCGKEIVLGEV